jgi:hypothetical protein
MKRDESGSLLRGILDAGNISEHRVTKVIVEQGREPPYLLALLSAGGSSGAIVLAGTCNARRRRDARAKAKADRSRSTSPAPGDAPLSPVHSPLRTLAAVSPVAAALAAARSKNSSSSSASASASAVNTSGRAPSTPTGGAAAAAAAAEVAPASPPPSDSSCSSTAVINPRGVASPAVARFAGPSGGAGAPAAVQFGGSPTGTGGGSGQRSANGRPSRVFEVQEVPRYPLLESSCLICVEGDLATAAAGLHPHKSYIVLAAPRPRTKSYHSMWVWHGADETPRVEEFLNHIVRNSRLLFLPGRRQRVS